MERKWNSRLKVQEMMLYFNIKKFHQFIINISPKIIKRGLKTVLISLTRELVRAILTI